MKCNLILYSEDQLQSNVDQGMWRFPFLKKMQEPKMICLLYTSCPQFGPEPAFRTPAKAPHPPAPCRDSSGGLDALLLAGALPTQGLSGMLV